MAAAGAEAYNARVSAKWFPTAEDADSPRQRLVRWALVALLGGVVALGVWHYLSLLNQEAGPSPAGRQNGGAALPPRTVGPAPAGPATAPATAPAAPAGPAGGLRFPRLADALDLPQAEQGLYDMAVLRKRQLLQDNALGMWLDRVRRMPALTYWELMQLDQPGWLSLADPNEHRRFTGRAVRMEIFPVRIIRLEPGKDFRATRWWTVHDGPIWRVDALNALTPQPQAEPVYLLLPFDPTDAFGRPSTIEGEAAIYAPEDRRRFEVAGVYYKIYRSPTTDSALLFNYPVLIGSQVVPAAPRGGTGGGIAPESLGLVGVVMVLLFGFLILKRRLSRGGVKRPAAGAKASSEQLAGELVQRRRQQRAADEKLMAERRQRRAARQQDLEPTSDPDTPVDPDLARAAEEYRKQKGLDDEPTDHPG